MKMKRGFYFMKSKDRKPTRFTEESGITILALITTIVVMIILLVVSSYFAFGENGAIQQALASKKAHENASNEEGNVFNYIIDFRAEDYLGNEFTTPDTPSVNPPVKENMELKNFKTSIAHTITSLGIATSPAQSVNRYITNLEQIGNTNYAEGVRSDLVVVATGLSSRYEQTISVANIDGYEQFDVADFIIVNQTMTYTSGNDGHNILSMTKNYDKSTGTLVLGRLKSYNTKWTFWNIYDVYLVKRNPQPTIAMALNEDTETEPEPENVELNEFKQQLGNAIGVENAIDKSAEEMANEIRQFARKKFEEGVSTYFVLLQGSLNSRYAQSVSATNMEQYENATLNQFLITITAFSYVEGSDGENIVTMSKSYNNSNGILSLGKQKSYTNDSGSRWTFFNIYNVYFLKKPVKTLDDL